MARKKSSGSTPPPSPISGRTVRPLGVDDLERVVAIDRKLSGRARRGFYETRLKAAIREPKRFIYVGLCDGEALDGFVLVRLLEGEFGGEAPVAVLDAIGVDPDHQGSGAGRALLAGLEDVMRQKGVPELQSQLDWNNHTLMRFLDGAGFRLAPRVVLSRPVAEPVAF